MPRRGKLRPSSDSESEELWMPTSDWKGDNRRWATAVHGNINVGAIMTPMARVWASSTVSATRGAAAWALGLPKSDRSDIARCTRPQSRRRRSSRATTAAVRRCRTSTAAPPEDVSDEARSASLLIDGVIAGAPCSTGPAVQRRPSASRKADRTKPRPPGTAAPASSHGRRRAAI